MGKRSSTAGRPSRREGPIETLERRLFADGSHAVAAAAEPSVTLAWAAKRSAPSSRDEANGATIGDNLYLFGGFHSGTWKATSRVDRFDVRQNEWTRLRDLPTPVTHAATVGRGNSLWLIGGFLGDLPGPAVRDVWIYDARTDTYSAGPSLPEPRGAGAAALIGNTVVYFGGNDRGVGEVGDDKRTTWTLDLASADPQWVRRAMMPRPLNHLAGVALGGTAYAIGGQTGVEERSHATASVARFNPKRNRWDEVASLPNINSHILASAFVRDGKIYAVGGEAVHNVSCDAIYRYDPSRDEWTTYGRLPQGRRSPVASLFGDELIVTTGSYDKGRQTADTIRTRLFD